MAINALSLITAQSNRKPYKFDIPNSLRFDDQSETKFTRTFSGLSSDVTTATLSFWVKRTKFDHEGTIICRDGNPWFCVFAANKLATRTNPGDWYYYSDRVYRDSYAWYHIFIKVNSSGCTLYLNGQLEGTATYPGAILTTGSSELRLGYESSNNSHFAGYLSEFYFIDETNSGSSLDVNDFGRTDKYGNWVPKKTKITNYGDNGFYLDFSDVNDIGADRSGNNNHFTPSGFNTSGNFDNDYSLDSPTNNYATWNTSIPHVTTSHGGLNITNQRNCTTTFGKFKTGKYYFEWNATQGGYIGVTDNIDSWGDDTTPFAHSDDSLGYYAANQKVYRNSSTGVTYGSSPIQSGVLAMAVDFDNGSIEYFHNGSSIGYATTVTSALTSGKEYYIAGQGLDTTNDIKTNFGQQPFIYTPPTGFVGLHRKTLPAQKFIDGTDHFRTILVDSNTATTTSGAVTNVTDNGGKNWSISGYVSLDNAVSYYMDPNNELDAILLNERNSEFQSTYPSNFYTYPNVRVTFTFSPALENSSARFYAYCDWACTSLHTVARPQYNGTTFDMSHTAIVTKSGTTSSVSFYTKPWTAPYSASISQVGNIQSNGSYDVFVDNQIVLTFANSSDVTGFAAGQLVYKQGDTTVRGKVESVNSASSPYTITIRSNSTWGNGDVLQNTNILNEAKTIFPSGLWWIKDRQNNNQHQLVDSVRVNDKALTSPTLDADGEIEYAAPSGNSVAWCWKAGGAAVSNGNGSITSSVSANIDAGFSIVTYTGTGSNATIGHGLTEIPELVFYKRRNSNNGWVVYSSELAATEYLQLHNALDPETGSSSMFNSLRPTNSVLNVGTNTSTNDSGGTYVAYVWTSVPGYSAFGSYSGNQILDGSVIMTGFKPAFVLIKNITPSSNNGWIIYDSTRNPSNPTNRYHYAQEVGLDNTGREIDFLSNGFKKRNPGIVGNYNNHTYIYAAFAEKPSFAKNFSSANPR